MSEAELSEVRARIAALGLMTDSRLSAKKRRAIGDLLLVAEQGEQKLAALREHTLDSNPALRALHDQAVLYRNAVQAYGDVHGPLSTSLEWVIRHGSLARLAAADRENAELRGDVERLQRRLFPGQGESYANEVERQRVVIDTMQDAIAGRTAERDDLRAQLAAAQSQLAEARAWLAKAEPHPDLNGNHFAGLAAALSAAPQPEPDPIGKPCTIAPSVGGPVYDRNEVRCWHEGGLWHDLAEPPASDEPPPQRNTMIGRADRQQS